MSLKPLAGIGLLFAALALWHGMKATTSLWPGVALFCLSGLLACVAACIDAASESAKHESDLDTEEERARVQSALDKQAEAIVVLEVKIDHLQKKDALNALG